MTDQKQKKTEVCERKCGTKVRHYGLCDM